MNCTIIGVSAREELVLREAKQILARRGFEIGARRREI